MNSRERILATLRTATAQPVAMTHTRPRLPTDDRVSTFEARLASAAATSVRIADERGILPAIEAYLATLGDALPAIAVAPALIDDLPELGTVPPLQASVAVTACIAAVAETGSVLMASGPEHPTTLNFLPETHIVIVRTEQIVAHLEDAWARVTEMPRALNLITGPSRTADIEQTLQLGAHGPRRLHLLIVGE